jgi:hypothetical protein
MKMAISQWAVTGMAVLALGAMGIGAGVAAADPGDGVNGSVGSTGGADLTAGPFGGGFNNGTGGGFNVGPNGIGGQAGQANTGGANLGPFGGSAGENVNGGANFGW